MKIVIGKTAEGKNISFELDILLVTRLLIQANSGAGKSWLLRRLMEELFGHVQVITIDPEGEFATLREKFDYVLVGKGGETPAHVSTAAEVAQKLLELRASAVCDLYEMPARDRHEWVKTFLSALIDAPKKLWHPVVIIVDEAQMFCPEKGAGESEASGAMVDLTTRGRKRGFCPVWATQRLAKVSKDATSMLLNRLVGGTFEDVDIKRALDLLSVAPEDKRDVTQQLKTLDPGWFYAFGRAVCKERLLFKVGEVKTSHPKPGSAKHAAEPPAPSEKVRAMLGALADIPKVAEEKARTVQEFKARIRELTTEVSQLKKAQPKPVAAAPASKGIDKATLKRAVEESVLKTVGFRDEQWMRAIESYTARLERSLTDGLKRMDGALHVVKFDVPPKIRKIDTTIELKEVESQAQAGVAVHASALTPQPRAPLHAMAEKNGDLSKSQFKILAALAEFEAIGRASVPKKWIAAMAGASHSSSAFGNNLGALRSLGLINYPVPGEAALTETGRNAAPQVDPPNSPAEMLARCKQIVSSSQASILDALQKAYPEPLGKVELAEASGASPTSSAFGNNLGALRSAGMIEYPAQGQAKLSNWVMLEED